jgi:hypothetical protein
MWFIILLLFLSLFLIYTFKKSSDMCVVVSRYKEDVNWTKKLKHDCKIYEKETPSSKYNIPVNKGHEASVYFKYIIDHYDNLPDYVAFVHGHESDWHHPSSMATKLNAIHPSGEYINLNENTGRTGVIVDENDEIILKHDDPPGHWGPVSDWWRQVMKPFFGNRRGLIVNDMWGGQFIVSKKSILRHSLKFYETQYNWLLTTDLDNSASARYYEWVWKFIFTTDSK